MNTKKETQHTAGNVIIVDAAIKKAWREKYGNNLRPSENFEAGFLAGCRFANEYIMKKFYN